MAKRKGFRGMLALTLTFGLVLVFGLVLSGCLTTGDSNQNNIGEIIGDNFALVRAPVAEYVGQPGMVMATFDGNDLTIFNKYKITKPFMGLGDPTIDLKVTPGRHEFTMHWKLNDKTLIATQHYDFTAGKWYVFTSHHLSTILTGDNIPITMREGTLEAGNPKGEVEVVLTFQVE